MSPDDLNTNSDDTRTNEVHTKDAQQEQFVQALTESQSRLYAYINTMAGGSSDAWDVLQETNLVLWRKIDEFDHDRPFLPWAYKIAYYQSLAHLKRRSKRAMVLDPHTIDAVAQRFAETDGHWEARVARLSGCLNKLPDDHRKLIDMNYFGGKSVNEIADLQGKNANTVSALLYRIRKRLMACIEYTPPTAELATEAE